MENQDIQRLQEEVRAAQSSFQLIRTEMGRIIVGQEKLVDRLLLALIADGHVLLEGVPGLAKTLAVRTLAQTLNGSFARLQFTPDLLPADLIGTRIYNASTHEFSTKLGPVFANIVLADEINRAPAKVQSALLEAMQEKQVTIAGESFALPKPFLVLATQNPIEQEGTYPLPEAQLDRFMFKLIVPNPTLKELMEIVDMTQKTMKEVADAVCSAEDLLKMRETANAIPVARDVLRYAMYLTSATHPDSECASETAKKYVRVGASPRAGQALISAAKVKALINGRFNVSFSDIEELALPVLRHRLKLNFEAVAERISADEVVTMIVEEVRKDPKNKELKK